MLGMKSSSQPYPPRITLTPPKESSNAATITRALRYVALENNGLRQLPSGPIEGFYVKIYNNQQMEKFIPPEVNGEMVNELGRLSRRRWYEVDAAEPTPEQAQPVGTKQPPKKNGHDTRSPSAPKGYVAEELNYYRKIHAEAKECFAKPVSDAAWHLNVHIPLMKHSTAGFCTLKSANVAKGIFTLTAPFTTVDGHRVLRGTEMELDVAVVLHRPQVPVPEYMMSAMRKISSDFQGPGRDQMGYWIYGWTRPHPFRAGPEETVPVMLVTGNYWKLMFLVDRGEAGMEVIGDMPIGDTLSLVGIYRLVAALRDLARWSDGKVVEGRTL
jgi:hypothetical protein